MIARPRRALAVAAIACVSAAALALPPSREEVVKWCTDADDMAHCGRLIEAQQMKRLPGLAKREGVDLRIALFPSGTATFTDVENPLQPLSYSFYDTIDPINGVLVFKTDGEKATFVLLQRTSNRTTDLPSEPKLSPDRQHLVTADFCASDCANELAIWRVARSGVTKALVYRTTEDWTDAIPRWKDAETVVVDYQPAGGGPRRTFERKLSAGGWLEPR
ncbi:MAG: hypothetical protein AMXMBFR42_12820 [Burkholderiales bacterium]